MEILKMKKPHYANVKVQRESRAICGFDVPQGSPVESMAYNLQSMKAIQITWGQTGAWSCQGESYSSTKTSAWLEVGRINEQTCIMAKYYYYRSQIMSGFMQPPWRGKIALFA